MPYGRPSAGCAGPGLAAPEPGAPCFGRAGGQDLEGPGESTPAKPHPSRPRRWPPLLGIPVYAIFDLRTGSGAVFTDIHPTPAGPRYVTRKDFVHGEEVTIAEWTIATDGLPRYADDSTTQGAS